MKIERWGRKKKKKKKKKRPTHRKCVACGRG
jgi:hypothetical protein